MEKIVEEYEKHGFNIKIYSPILSENEKLAEKIEIKQKIINLIKNKM